MSTPPATRFGAPARARACAILVRVQQTHRFPRVVLRPPWAAHLALSLLVGCASAPPPPPPVEPPPPPPPVEPPPPPPPLPELAPRLRHIVDASGKQWPLEDVPVDQATCRKLSKWPADLMECWLEPLALGTAARLVAQTSCSGDYCDWEAWLFADGTARPQQPAPDELSRDHSVAYIEVGIFGAEVAVEVDKRLVRVDRASRKQRPLGNCFSPSISPAGAWVLCRNRAGAVLAVPALGGDIHPLLTPKVRPEDVLWQPQFYAVPSKVRFVTPNSMRYRVELMPNLTPRLERMRAELEGPFTIEWHE